MKKIVFIVLIWAAGSCLASDFQPKLGASGADTFAQACAACHGDDGQGKFGLFFDLTSSTLETEAMKTIIQNGGALMPSFANIKGEELNALITHVHSLATATTSK